MWRLILGRDRRRAWHRRQFPGLFSGLVYGVYRAVHPAFAALHIAARIAGGIEAMNALAVTAFAELRLPLSAHLHADHNFSRPQRGIYVTGNLAKPLIEVARINALTGKPKLQDLDIFGAVENFAGEQAFHEHAQAAKDDSENHRQDHENASAYEDAIKNY